MSSFMLVRLLISINNSVTIACNDDGSGAEFTAKQVPKLAPELSPHVGLAVRGTAADSSAHPQQFQAATTPQEQNSFMHLQRAAPTNNYLYSDGMSGFNHPNLPAWGYGGQMFSSLQQQQQQYLMMQQHGVPMMFGQQQAAPRRRPSNAANNAALQIALALIASQPPQDE